MRAILVCVDYADLLAVTLEYNRHHFSDVLVVTSTSLADEKTKRVCLENDAIPFFTDSFYDDGAIFNKWKALEEGLDAFGRHGWLCIMDADVLWPKTLPQIDFVKGKLYTPYRRMFCDMTKTIPEESEWSNYPRHRVKTEWAGYSQIFHAEDSCLGNPPWHEINWTHAGGADSFFQRKWHVKNKIRPPFEVLHLGEAGVNWCGRATQYLDGSEHPEAHRNRDKLHAIFHERRRNRNYDHEKLRGE